MSLAKTRSNLFVAAIFSAGMATAAQAACQDLVTTFDEAVAARSIDAARRALAGIGDDVVCGARVDEFRGKLVDFLVTYAGTAGVADTDRNRATAMAQAALEISRNWQGAQKLADYFMSRREKVNAHHWYEQSVSFLNTNPSITATPIERHTLLTKLAAAQSLVNDDHEGTTPIRYVPTMRDAYGSPCGIYCEVLLRGTIVVNVPIPINFYTNEARFTPTGEAAVRELVEAIRAQQVQTMKLIGHADPRGTPQYNLDLSRRRVEAVRDKLVQEGVRADIRIEWKGAQQPFDVNVLPYRPSQEEIWQLDRRVEWVRNALP
jgi:outer membrane protein OmpA-like peptidoglycan-associated protein